MVIYIIKWLLIFRNHIKLRHVTKLVQLSVMQLILWRHVTQFGSGCTHQTFLVCCSRTLEVFQLVYLKWTRAQNTQHVVQHGNGMKCTLKQHKCFPQDLHDYFMKRKISCLQIHNNFPQPPNWYWIFTLLHTFASTSKTRGLKDLPHNKASIS